MIHFSLIGSFVHLGPSVIGVGHIGQGEKAVSREAVSKLSIQWRHPQANLELLPLLSWHNRISEFTGREEEKEKLEVWADNWRPVSVKFITGDGGVGKSRLAAEFAETLRGQGWSSGFINPKMPHNFPLNKTGTLLVIDYPEENREEVTGLLRDLASIEYARESKLRVLFLTRQDIENWRGVIHDSNALDLVDTDPIVIGILDDRTAYDLYSSAMSYLEKEFHVTPNRLSEADLCKWLGRSPDNRRALLILAQAVQSAFDEAPDARDHTSREVMEAIVEREISRLSRIGQSIGAEGHCFPRLLSMAAIANAIPITKVKEFVKEQRFELGFNINADVESRLEATGILNQRMIPAPKPDIVAAAFTVKALSQRPETAGELIWAALSLDIKGGLERISRLCYDAEILLGIHEHRISRWLAEALDGKRERCEILFEFFQGPSPLGLQAASVAIYRTLLSEEKDIVC